MQNFNVISTARLGVAVYLSLSFLAVVDSQTDVSEASAVNYLMEFGYLKSQDPRTGELRSMDALRDAILEFQGFAGLNQTGVLDDETKQLIKLPRCGVADKIGNGVRARRKRYTLQGSKWPKKTLTYRITTYTSKLQRAEVDDAVERAFQVWSDVSQLRFVPQASGRVDIEIKFASGAHGDGNPFDGRGRTLAHAFFPQFGGDAHFDESERWTVYTSAGTDLFQVAAHEFGHSLGLSHSQVRSALMAPFYRGYQANFKLDQDDISAIQILYGRRQVATQPTTRIRPVVRGGRTTVSNSRPRGSYCRDVQVDAITRTSDGTTYAFRGTEYFVLKDDGVAPGYPQPISSGWRDVQGPIDAAITLRSGTTLVTYIFQGSRYWKFLNRRPYPSYPRDIRRGFSGLPDNIDAAFTWSGNGQPYFVKGNYYWRYSMATGKVAAGYPRSLRNWRGLPQNVDAIFEWSNDRTYFFKGQNYYRFNDKEFRVDSGYPRDIGQWWFGCSGNHDPQLQPQGGNPTINAWDIHEAKVNSDQYNGPVLSSYPDKQDGHGDNNNVSGATTTTTNIVLILAITLVAFIFP